MKYNQKLAGIAMKENLSTAMYVVSEDKPIKMNYKMEVLIYYEAERIVPAMIDYEEYDFTDNRDVIGDNPVAEPISEDTQVDNAEQEVAGSLEAGAYAKSKSDMDNVPVIGAGVEGEEEMSESVDGFGVVASGYNDRKSESVISRLDGHEYDFDGLMDEADMIFKAARRGAIHETAENTAQVIEMLYETYENM